MTRPRSVLLQARLAALAARLDTELRATAEEVGVVGREAAAARESASAAGAFAESQVSSLPGTPERTREDPRWPGGRR